MCVDVDLDVGVGVGVCMCKALVSASKRPGGKVRPQMDLTLFSSYRERASTV